MLLTVPWVIAAAVLAGRHWFPVLDLAMTELRVRDVGTSHTPLIGLPGRIGVFPDQGSHPGPLSYYLLAPTYRIVGSSAWGLELGMILLALGAVALVLWLAHRRGGRPLMLVFAAVVLVVVFGYGFEVLTQPWNPYLPLMFWLVVLLATWSVLCDDVAMLPVLVGAGSLCAQTHMPYLGLCVGLGAGAIVWATTGAIRRADERRRRLRWIGTSLAFGFVLWLPVLIDQARHTPGNLSMLRDYFQNPPEQPAGALEGIRLALRHLDVFRMIGLAFQHGPGFFLDAGFRLDGAWWPGLVVLAVWLVAAWWSLRIGHRLLQRLHIVVGAALLLGAVSMGRIFGKVWYYLTLWAWTTTTLLVVAVVWTVIAAVPRTRSRGRAVRRAALPAGAVLAATLLVAITVDAATVQPPEAQLSRSLGHLVGPTADALRRGDGAADGAGGRYVITWSDAANFGSQGYGLVSELERRGFDAGLLPTWHVPITDHRVITADEATAEVHLATGVFVAEWEAMPGAVEVASYDPRNDTQRAEFEALRAGLIADLTALGLDDLVDTVDTNLFGVQLDPRVPPRLQQSVDRMLVLGQPLAIFIVPAGTSG